jgi:GTP-binding protein
VTDYLTVNRELAAYNSDLAKRAQFVVASKIDALDEPARLDALKTRALEDGRPFYAVSSVTGQGVRELIHAIVVKLDELKATENNETVELVL